MDQIYNTNNFEEIINYLKEKNIIKNVGPVCSYCNKVKEWRKKADAGDKYGWRCTKCSTFSSIKYNSFLESYKFPIIKTVKLIEAWAFEYKIVDVCSRLDISKPTVIKFFQQLREIACVDLNQQYYLLGGFGKICEMDESLFVKAKHNKGRVLSQKQIWVFGILERDSKKIHFEVVKSRDKRTLIPVITNVIAPGSLIYTDGWKAYSGLEKLDGMDYSHNWVNHKLNFVDPSNGTHTQGIESIWRAAKQKFKQMNGVSRDFLKYYLDEFMWRYMYHNNRQEVFNHIIQLIPELHLISLDSKKYAFDDDDDDFQLEFDSDCDANDDDEIIDEQRYLTQDEINLANQLKQLSIENQNEREKLDAWKANKQKTNKKSQQNRKEKLFIRQVEGIMENLDGTFTFKSELNEFERRVIRELAEEKKLYHQTVTTGETRKIRISKEPFVNLNEYEGENSVNVTAPVLEVEESHHALKLHTEQN